MTHSPRLGVEDMLRRIVSLPHDTVLESAHELTVELWPVGTNGWTARLVDYGGSEREDVLDVDAPTLERAVWLLLCAAEDWLNARLAVTAERDYDSSALTPYHTTLAHY